MDTFFAFCKAELQKKNSELPIYRRIAEALRKLILDGSLPKGCKLPPESECAERLGINLRTLRKSLKLLSEQGLLSQCRGRGTFVSYEQKHPFRLGMLFLSNFDLATNSYHARMLYELFCLTERHPECEVILITAPENATAADLQSQFQRCRCDGVICFVHGFIQPLSERCFDHFPLVFFNLDGDSMPSEKRYSVHSKQGAVRMAIRHFLDRKIRKVRYVSSEGSNYEPRNREFAKVRKNYRLKAPIMIPLNRDGSISRAATDEICRLFSAKTMPRAFIVSNAMLAAGVYHAVLHYGLRVPEDVTIVGFDLNRAAYPGCGSLSQPVRDMLESAFALLQAQRLGTGKILNTKQYFFPVQLLCD